MACSKVWQATFAIVTFIATASLFTDTQGEPQKCKGKADILFLMDGSGSIGPENFGVLLKFMADMTKHFTIGPNAVQFSAFVYSTDVLNLFNFSTLQTNEAVYQAIINSTYLNGGTNTGLALTIARMYSFSPLSGARQNVMHIVVVITDGLSNDANETAYQGGLLKASGKHVFAIGVGPGVYNKELLAIASSPKDVYTVENFGVLDAIKNAVVTTACESSKNITPCVSDSCVGKADGNYPPCNHQCKEGFYYSCVSGFRYTMNCPLGYYTHKNGTRFCAKKIYIEQTDSCERNAPYCARNHEEYAVVPPPSNSQPTNYSPPCIGPSESCKGRSNGNYPMCYPDCQNGFFYYCFNDETYQKPCPPGSYTDKQNQSYQTRTLYHPPTGSCKLQTDYCHRDVMEIRPKPSPKLTESQNDDLSDIPTYNSKSDIMMIIDTSGSVDSINFGNLVSIVVQWIHLLPVGPDANQVAAVTYSSTPTLEFSFNRHRDNKSVWQALLSMRYKGGSTNTAAALTLALDVFLSPGNGSRGNVTKTVVVFTDGISDDEPAATNAAHNLKRHGVKVFVIPIGPSVRISEIQAIASSPENVFHAPSFDQLNSISRAVIKAICQAPNTTTDPDSSCGNRTCDSRPDGNYPECFPQCQQGFYYSCSNKKAYKMKCATMWYTDSQNKRFEASGVFNPDILACDYTSSTCRRNAADYRIN